MTIQLTVAARVRRAPRFVFVAAVAPLALALFVSPVRLAHADPLVSAFVGTGVNTSYFVLDFKNGDPSNAYVLGYRWNTPTAGNPPNGGNLLDALRATGTGAPGFSATVNGTAGVGFGRFVSALGYGGVERAGGGAAFPNGYWSYWIRPSDTASWVSSNDGIDTTNRFLTNGSYDGWSFVSDYNTVTPTAPRVPQAVAVPEPATAALVLPGLLGLGVCARRKKRI